MRVFIRTLAFFVLLPCPPAAAAAEAGIRFVGVVGNTGEQGAALLQQTTDRGFRGHSSALGCGVALDRQGTIWTRIEHGVITRMALDGRQIGRFPSPTSSSGFDTLLAIDDRVLLLAGNELHALSLNAPPGTAFTSLGVKARTIAHTLVKGRLAMITPDSRIAWLDTKTGKTEIVSSLPDSWLIEARWAGGPLCRHSGQQQRPRPDAQVRQWQGDQRRRLAQGVESGVGRCGRGSQRSPVGR